MRRYTLIFECELTVFIVSPVLSVCNEGFSPFDRPGLTMKALGSQ